MLFDLGKLMFEITDACMATFLSVYPKTPYSFPIFVDYNGPSKTCGRQPVNHPCNVFFY